MSPIMTKLDTMKVMLPFIISSMLLGFIIWFMASLLTFSRSAPFTPSFFCDAVK